MASDIFSRVGAVGEKLNEAEHRLINSLLERRDELALLSGPKLAERLDVHGAAPTRLAQKLGYKGYPELRRALQQDMLKAHDAAQRMRRSVELVAEGNFLADLVGSEIAALQGLLDAVSQASINDAADAIFAGRKVFVFAQGHAQAVAHFLIRRLNRFGMTTIALSGRNRDIAERLVGMSSEDVVLSLAFRRQPAAYSAIMSHVRKTGASSILISDLAGLFMTPSAEIILAAPRGRSQSEFQTPTVPLAIVSTILLTLAARHEAATIGSLERLSELFAEFEDHKGGGNQ
ncbi:MAG: MurR/RpiR family transcriptional regulator [Natronohydrobacter sp.]|nr:MurR/RpiR family transcriptional regulator [Natronohydrobacter sp.]